MASSYGFILVSCFLYVVIFLQFAVLNSEALQNLNYANYTSYKYKIQFQYPTDWQQSEKIDSRDKGVDIAITKNSNTTMAIFWIILGNGTELGSDSAERCVSQDTPRLA